ncbi:MAG: acetylxylan esterase [Verrucomicrobiales bacterium]
MNQSFSATAKVVFVSLLAFMTSDSLQAQPQANYDEAKVPIYTLPDPLTQQNGEKVTDARTWKEKRRPELLNLFRSEVYGRSPEPMKLKHEALNTDPAALGGKAIRKQVRVYFSENKSGPKMDILLYLPPGNGKKHPAFIGMNFNGNHSVHSDPGIAIADGWFRNNPNEGYVNNKATEKSRGNEASRWQVEKVLSSGYALATIYYGDVDPDFDDGFKNGIHPLFYKEGQTKPAPDEWGSVAAWAWGLSRAMDYLEQEASIDAQKVALIGHSRLGKTALWAGAEDERFAIVISNNSGCGGAALSKRAVGETVERINKSFPHWFCDNFNKYNANEGALPVDQHQLIALIAPRPVYVASAVEDQWADPKGEFLGAWHANPVYKLLGTEGLPADKMPAVDQPIAGTIGYHIRSGKHDVTAYDWEQYLKFADKHFGRK